MDLYLALKWFHIISATVLFGTGLGTAFQSWMAQRTGDLRALAVVNRNVVLADWLFTTPAVIVQPITGFWMAHLAGLPLGTPWLAVSLALYILVGVCWLPVVWLQIRMYVMVRQAAAGGDGLDPLYFRFKWIWFMLGWPAFIGVLAIFYLMVFKPDF
jgi:uncharacterized membrane protein